ncbi:LETM1 domain-containing protein 1 [Lucilia cuprina]|uniref:LETM1 domain-containing protein 1 n=1 Tax=Lucilia cuprina TaxID=7375 RepID=UPI001F06E492|nr:LETM1 domain-containing protein 1 [Lucilia cuprina]
MTLALRLTRLPVIVYQETVFQHSCLGNPLRRQYVTSSDHTSKKPTAPSTSPIPPKNADFTPPPTENADKQKTTVSSKRTEIATKSLSESVTKLQQLAEKRQEAVSKVKLSTQQVRKNVRGYMFTRFFDYVKNYDTVLEKNFPSAVKVYRVFFDGVKDFFSDMKRFLKVARIVNSSSKGLKSLNRQELELYMQMPKDMVKVAPALIFSSLPMVGYAIFPLVFMYPRSFLTSHFWTPQQKDEFKQFYFHERLTYNKPVFRCLQSKLKSTKKHPKHEEFRNVLGQLGSGTHPSVEQILDIKDIFSEAPYSLISLPGKHIKLLTKLHGLPRGWFKRHSLYEQAFLVHYMDLAIGREGGVHNMPLESLRNACYIRGLNPVDLSPEEMIEWLRDWIKVSNSIKAEHITLFLHLPLFLGYNHPNNWQLLYGKDKKQQPQTTTAE